MTEDEASLPQPLATIEMIENVKGRPTWTLRLFEGAMELDRGHGVLPTTVDRADVPRRVELHDGLILRRVLSIELNEDSNKKTIFVLESRGFAELDRWVGPPTRADLKVAIAARMGMRWTLPVGAVWIFLSLPRDGSPSQGIEPSPMQEEKIAIGVALVLLGVLPRIFTHRVLFLCYSVWFSAFAADCILDTLRGHGAWFLAPLAVAGIFLAMGGLRQFHRFSVLRPEPTTTSS